MILAVLIAVLVGRNHATSSSSNIMKLVMLQRNGSMIAAKHDSACLDGSDYGYYILKSNKSSQWVISFQGKGSASAVVELVVVIRSIAILIVPRNPLRFKRWGLVLQRDGLRSTVGHSTRKLQRMVKSQNTCVEAQCQL